MSITYFNCRFLSISALKIKVNVTVNVSVIYQNGTGINIDFPFVKYTFKLNHSFPLVLQHRFTSINTIGYCVNESFN